jgi:hypothetical protein
MESCIILRAYQEDCKEKEELFEGYSLLTGASLTICKEESETWEEECKIFKEQVLKAFSNLKDGDMVFFIGRDLLLKNASKLFRDAMGEEGASIRIARGTATASLFELCSITKNEKTINFIKNLDPSSYSKIKHAFPSLRSFTVAPHREEIKKINLSILEGKIDISWLPFRLTGWGKVNDLFSKSEELLITDVSRADIITRNIMFKNALQLQEENKLFRHKAEDNEFAIVTVMDDTAALCFEEFKKSYIKYCDKHGFSLCIFKEAHLDSIPANWSKAFYLENVIKKYKSFMWVDTDTVVKNYEENALEFLKDSGLDVTFFEDAANTGPHKGDLPGGWKLNSGVFLLKDSECGREVLKKWNSNIQETYKKNGNKLESVYVDGGDQMKLIQAYDELKGKFEEKMQILPCNVYNTYPKFASEETCIVHFMGYGNYSLRAMIMAEHNKKYMS